MVFNLFCDTYPFAYLMKAMEPIPENMQMYTDSFQVISGDLRSPWNTPKNLFNLENLEHDPGNFRLFSFKVWITKNLSKLYTYIFK